MWCQTREPAAHQTQSHLHIPHLLFTRLPFIIKDNFMDRSFNGWEILIKHIQQETEKSGARGQHGLVCVAKAHVLGKYCMQIKCRSKQKKRRKAAKLAESRILGLSILPLPDVLDYTLHRCFWGVHVVFQETILVSCFLLQGTDKTNTHNKTLHKMLDKEKRRYAP